MKLLINWALEHFFWHQLTLWGPCNPAHVPTAQPWTRDCQVLEYAVGLQSCHHRHTESCKENKTKHSLLPPERCTSDDHAPRLWQRPKQVDSTSHVGCVPLPMSLEPNVWSFYFNQILGGSGAFSMSQKSANSNVSASLSSDPALRLLPLCLVVTAPALFVAAYCCCCRRRRRRRRRCCWCCCWGA